MSPTNPWDNDIDDLYDEIKEIKQAFVRFINKRAAEHNRLVDYAKSLEKRISKLEKKRRKKRSA